MSAENDPIVILADTNAAYKIFFFVQKQVLNASSLDVANVGKIVFHPIVLEEITAHVEAIRILREYGYTDVTIPKLFSGLDEKQIASMIAFVRNHTLTLNIDCTNNSDFVNSRKVYEKERIDLQTKWKANGTKGRKVDSKPSLNDYLILFCAQEKGYKLLTNDEILLSIAESILEDGCTYRTEDIIRAAITADSSKKAAAVAAVDNLEFLGESIIKARIFS